MAKSRDPIQQYSDIARELLGPRDSQRDINVFEEPMEAQPQREMSILFLEDDTKIRNIVKRIFSEEQQYVWDESETGDDAVGKIFEGEYGQYDVVITDLRHPGIGGEDIPRLVKMQHPLTQVIVLTGAHDSDIRYYGEDYLINKPFSPMELIEIVKKAEEEAEKRSEWGEEEKAAHNEELEERFRKVDEEIIRKSGWPREEVNAYLSEYSRLGLNPVLTLASSKSMAMTNVHGDTVVNLGFKNYRNVRESAPFIATHELMEMYYKKGFIKLDLGEIADPESREAAIDWAAIKYRGREAIESY